jgi:hypothetical protein
MVTTIRSFLFLLVPVIVYAHAGLVSLRPLYTPETAVLNPALIDLWTEKGSFLSITFRIEPDGDSGYRVVEPHDQKEFVTIHLVQLGGETIADIVFIPQSSPPQLSVHCFARLRVEGNTLHVAFLGGERILQQIERTGSPRYERLTEDGWDGEVLILPASTAELRQFVLDCLKQPDAFGSYTDMSSTYERAGPEKRAWDLNAQSWPVVSWGGASAEEYARALKQAEEAVMLVSDHPDYWSTLGAAQYRVGRFREALTAITRAEQLRKSASPEDLIFRAMSHQQLGQNEEAKTVLLGDLSKMLRDPGYLGDLQRYCGQQDKRSLLLEAENLIAPKAK